MGLARFGVSLDEDLLEPFDALCARKGYGNRSEAIRDLIRRALVEEDWQNPQLMGAGTLLFQLFPDAIVSIFGSESDLYREFAVKSLKIFLLFILLNGFQLCTGTFFQAIGKPLQATLISLSRQVLFLLPALLILPHFMGVEGALWAGPVGDACAFVLALVFRLVELRKTSRNAQAMT